MAYNRKIPDIPIELIRDTLDSQPATISGSFWNVLIWWLYREKLTPPTYEQIKMHCLLRERAYIKYKTILDELCDKFYPLFIQHVNKKRTASDAQSKSIWNARDKRDEKRKRLRKQDRMTDVGADMPLRVGTFIPETHTQSQRFDAELRANTLKSMKKAKDGILFND